MNEGTFTVDNIVISAHAAKRFQQRFQLCFDAGWFADVKSIRSLIVHLLNKSNRYNTWDKGSPSIRNRLFTKHGEFSARRSPCSNFIFILSPDEKMLRTIIRGPELKV